jgi:tetratricopeptide (TPR) repeat protein
MTWSPNYRTNAIDWTHWTLAATGVRAVFSWSYRLLPPATARMFRLLSLPTGADISLAAAADLAGTTHRETRRLLAELTRANLLEQHTPGRFHFHDLLRAYATECATQDESPEDRQAALRRLYDHYLQTSNAIYEQVITHGRPFLIKPPRPTVLGLTFADNHDALEWWEAEQPNLVAAIVHGRRLALHVHTWQLLQTLTYFFKTGRYPDNWPTIYDAALNSARDVRDMRAEAWLLEELGTVYYNRREYRESERMSECSLPLFRQLGDHYFEAMSLIGIAVCRARRQQYEEAMQPILVAYELMSKLGSPDGQGYSHAVLGQVYAGLCRFDEAFSHFLEALDFYRDAGEKYGEGFALNDLANAYRAAGRLDDALDTYREAIALRREIGHRQGEAASLRGLGDALHESGDPQGAREAWHQALTIFEQLADPVAEELRSQLGT